ncbi:MAG: SMP-30/gluconolactonase/LRE family protein [Polyangiales bacterium]
MLTREGLSFRMTPLLRSSLALIVLAAVWGCSEEPRDPLAGIGEVSVVADGFLFVEGPVWRRDQGVLLFSDVFGDRIHQLNPDGEVTEFRAPSNRTNGMAIDTNGLLLTAEFTTRRLTRTEANGDIVVVADTFEGSRLNETNDIVVRADGTIYFTDPSFLGLDRELDFNGLFRVSTDGSLSAEWRGTTDSQPNGLGLSPDESTLYVADTEMSAVYRFALAGDGSLEEREPLSTDVPSADGLTVGVDGNIWVAAEDGIRAYAPDGTLWGTIDIPKQPSNCAFGGADENILYVTARETLYQVPVTIP